MVETKPRGPPNAPHSIRRPDQATGKARELLDAVKAKLGVTLNMTKAMAARQRPWRVTSGCPARSGQAA